MGCDVDMEFLVPNGVLKIIEVVIGIVMMGVYPNFGLGLGFSSFGYAAYRNPVIGLGVVILLFTLVVFFCVLFKAYDQPNGGGKKTWIIVDIVHNCIGVLFYLVIVCLCADFVAYYDRVGLYGAAATSQNKALYQADRLVVALVFAILNLVAYIISLVISVFDFQGKKFGK